MARKEADEIIAAHEGGKPVGMGDLARVLHLFPDREEANRIWTDVVEPFQIAFWRKWYDLRRKHYEAVATRPWGTREAVAEFINPQDGDLIVNIGGGAAPQEPYLVREAQSQDPNARIGVILIDNNPRVERDAEEVLEELGDALFHREVVIDGVENVVPEIVQRVSTVDGARRVRGLSFYSLYQPLHLAAEQFSKLFEAGEELGVPTDMIVVVLNPEFDQRRLHGIFQDEIAPSLAQTEEGRKTLKEFREGYGHIGPHGDAVREAMPIWTVGELQDYFGNEGFRIVEKADILHGQTVCLRLQRV